MDQVIDKVNHESAATIDFASEEEYTEDFARFFGPAPAADSPVSYASVPLFLNHLLSGSKPRNKWQLGLEYEVVGYRSSDFERIDESEVRAVLNTLDRYHDLRVEPALSSGPILEESTADILTKDHITVEPGGQIEFSGAPRPSLTTIERNFRSYLTRLGEIASARGIVFLGIGYDPLRTIAEQHWFPKPRYEIMRPYLATRGRRAWDMMCRTCAMQVSVDYGSEQDLAAKYLLGNRLAPILTAIFANSPFENGKPSGYKSTRAAAWLQTDADRACVSPLAEAFDGFDEGFSLEAFVEYTFQVPMFFVRREGEYLAGVAGLKFGDFLNQAHNDLSPQFRDWTDHLTTIFTEARLKQYIEIRSADAGSLSMAFALQALLKGLMYDTNALEDALLLAPKLSASAMFALQEEVALHGLAARTSGVDVLSIAKQIIEIATSGLARLDAGEGHYLDPLREQVIEDELCPADILLRNWNGSWHGSMARLMEYVRAA